MHQWFENELTRNTYLMQFYYRLTYGCFSEQEIEEINTLNDSNVDRIKKFRNTMLWDGRYDLAFTQNLETKKIIETCKKHFPFQQVCSDNEIALYIQCHPDFFQFGIPLHEMKKLLDIERLFREGHMLHDVFYGYTEKHMYSLQVDCLDYLYSSSYFYNEGFDYLKGYKDVKDYRDIDISKIPPFEMKRIHSRDEIMFRTFRESYINIIFFIESFINSVGFDAYLAGSGITEEEKNKLRGIENAKNGKVSYSTLKQRIKNIPRILNGVSIDVGHEPFKTFLEFSVELRNQYVHSSVTKGKILYGIEDWKNKCDEMIEHFCTKVIMQFWKACYPTKSFPVVIFNALNGNSFKGHQGKYLAVPQ